MPTHSLKVTVTFFFQCIVIGFFPVGFLSFCHCKHRRVSVPHETFSIHVDPATSKKVWIYLFVWKTCFNAPALLRMYKKSCTTPATTIETINWNHSRLERVYAQTDCTLMINNWTGNGMKVKEAKRKQWNGNTNTRWTLNHSEERRKKMVVHSIGLHKLERATSLYCCYRKCTHTHTLFSNELFFSALHTFSIRFSFCSCVSWTHTFYLQNCTTQAHTPTHTGVQWPMAECRRCRL